MPKFGKVSQAQLKTVDERLASLMNEAIKYFDFSVLEGHRGEEAQNRAYAKGLSKLRWPKGNHNAFPSKAVDIAPYPIDWSNSEAARQRFIFLAGYIMCLAKQMNLNIRWGGDWNGNQDTRDESFRDLGHFEIRG